jgi:hypothetical protein
LFSNRSAAYIKKGDGENALADAEKCVQMSPSWPRVRSFGSIFNYPFNGHSLTGSLPNH